jgi:hypothetical protein
VASRAARGLAAGGAGRSEEGAGEIGVVDILPGESSRNEEPETSSDTRAARARGPGGDLGRPAERARGLVAGGLAGGAVTVGAVTVGAVAGGSVATGGAAGADGGGSGGRSGVRTVERGGVGSAGGANRLGSMSNRRRRRGGGSWVEAAIWASVSASSPGDL